MISLKIKTPLTGSSYYHIFNRGINRQHVFFTEDNYLYFLALVKKYCLNHMHILAYSLLPNHFHLIVKIKDELIITNQESVAVYTQTIPPRTLNDETEIGKQASKQLGKLFASYAMAINKQENRVGNLFDPKFKRLEITEQKHLEYAIFYTHYNPEKHGYSSNFRKYRFSSYSAISGNERTSINRELVWDIFGGKEDFLLYHAGVHHEIKKIILE
jgi:hypothetical protein